MRSLADLEPGGAEYVLDHEGALLHRVEVARLGQLNTENHISFILFDL